MEFKIDNASSLIPYLFRFPAHFCFQSWDYRIILSVSLHFDLDVCCYRNPLVWLQLLPGYGLI